MVATASPRNFELVKAAGANAVFDYSSPAFQIKIEQYLSKKVDLVLDCIGSLEGSVRPISKLAGPGTKVAVLLPVVVKDSSEDSEPEYAMDVGTVVDWEERVEVKGVRTHHYLEVCTTPCLLYSLRLSNNIQTERVSCAKLAAGYHAYATQQGSCVA